jgi:single-stranded DNA-specific DHH superfamily exonuclease
MAALAARHDLIICVDCGTLAHEALEAARAADVIVLDHHLGAETLPEARAVVNPNRQDETGDLAHLCAAAVVFMVLTQVARMMRENGQTPPNLINTLDLVALATVADVAPLGRGESGLCAPGPQGHGPAQTRGFKRPIGCRGPECCTKRLSSGLCLGTKN